MTGAGDQRRGEGVGVGVGVVAQHTAPADGQGGVFVGGIGVIGRDRWVVDDGQRHGGGCTGGDAVAGAVREAIGAAVAGGGGVGE